MTYNYYEEIAALAHANPEQEICGFLLQPNAPTLQVYATKNVTHEDKRFSWEIALAEQINFYRTGALFGLFHSHIAVDETFSDQDKRTATLAELPMIVYSVKTRKFNYFCPDCCIPAYTGRRFVLGVQDCMQVVMDYYHRELKIDLPFMLRDPDVVTKGFPSWEDYAKQANLTIVREGEPKNHDILVMSIKDEGINHVGVLVEPGLMLHQVWGRVSAIQTYTNSWRRATRFLARPA